MIFGSFVIKIDFAKLPSGNSFLKIWKRFNPHFKCFVIYFSIFLKSNISYELNHIAHHINLCILSKNAQFLTKSCWQYLWDTVTGYHLSASLGTMYSHTLTSCYSDGEEVWGILCTLVWRHGGLVSVIIGPL